MRAAPRRRLGWRLMAPLSVAAAAAFGGPSAFAGEPTKYELAAARDLFSRAERDEDAGRWADALDKLRRAGSVKMTSGIRFHIALCEEKLGQLVAALGDYTEADASARAEGNKEVLDAVTDPLAALRARVPTLTLVLPPDAQGASILLDGAPLAAGLAGTAVPVDAGMHSVQVRAPGRVPYATTVSLTDKQSATLDVRLPHEGAPPVLPASAAPGGPAAMARMDGSGASGGAGSNRVPALVASTGAAAFLGFGIASYFVAGGKQSSAEARCLMLTSCDDLKGGVRTWDALALGSWIAAAGATVAAVFFWTRPEKASAAAARVDAQVGPGSVRVVAQF